MAFTLDTQTFPHATGLALETVNAHAEEQDLVLWGSWFVHLHTSTLTKLGGPSGFALSYNGFGLHLRRKIYLIAITKYAILLLVRRAPLKQPTATGEPI